MSDILKQQQRDSLRVLIRLARFKKACKRLPPVQYPAWVKQAARKQGFKFN